MEKRVLALDIGDRRIGIAVSDPFNSYAMPVETYYRTGDFQKDVHTMSEFALSRGVGAIVCGLPVNADGTVSVQTAKTEKFIAALREDAAPMPVFTEDERFTSLQAHEVLHEEGFKAKKHKKNVDSIAASYILDGYLAKLNRKKRDDPQENQ